MEDNAANIMLSMKFSTDRNLVCKMIGNKKGRSIITTAKAKIDIITMNDMYAGKTILTPPFFRLLCKSLKCGKSIRTFLPSILKAYVHGSNFNF